MALGGLLAPTCTIALALDRHVSAGQWGWLALGMICQTVLLYGMMALVSLAFLHDRGAVVCVGLKWHGTRHDTESH